MPHKDAILRYMNDARDVLVDIGKSAMGYEYLWDVVEELDKGIVLRKKQLKADRGSRVTRKPHPKVPYP